MPRPSSQAAPIAGSERIVAIDTLRGFAVLGILFMNIQSFSMIEAAYFNPAASGFFESLLDRWIWIVSHLLSDQKFMTLFSILFGAGMVLMAERIEAAGRSPALLHLRRTFWLLVIGAAHAYLLWYGDVLVWYAMCGFLLFWLRRLRARNLLILGVLFLAVLSMIYLLAAVSLPNWPPEVVDAFNDTWQPTEERVEAEVSAYRGRWGEQMEMRVPTSVEMHTSTFIFFALWRAGGLMLVGMALFKWGVLSAERSAAFYRRLALVGFGIGLPMVSYGIFRCIESGWTLDYARFFGIQYNHWGSLLVSAGYLAIIMLWCRRPVLSGLKRSLAAVGRMALTNYLAQDDSLHAALLRPWPGVVPEDPTVAADPRPGLDSDSPAHLVSAVAPVLPLRTIRVVVAEPDLLRAAAPLRRL